MVLPYTDKPEGMLVYNTDGTMIVILMKPDRPLFESNDLLKGSDEVYEQHQPTKRVPDVGDSAVILGIFLRLSLFLAGRFCRPRPSAGESLPLGEAIVRVKCKNT